MLGRSPRPALARPVLPASRTSDAPTLVDLIDSISAAIVGIDVRGRVVIWNAAAETLFGWQRQEVLGRVPPIIPTPLRQEWRLQMRQVLEGDRGVVAAETQRISRTGRLVPVLRSSAPLHGPDGDVVGIVDTLTDITTHKQLDDESRALTQVRERELIAMDLHDGVIQSLYALSLRLAADERAPELDTSAARRALRSSREEIDRLVEEMRSYLLDLRAREFAPRELGSGLRLLLDALRLNAGIEPHLALDPVVDEQLDPEVRGHLLYVAREAISNVLRHADATEVSVGVAQLDDHVTLTVRDNGRGFDLAARGKRDQRGLRNMASRARLIGGRLDVSTGESGGTQIRLSLPSPSRRSSPGEGP
jgi:PAS domain S-box-containing protein